MTHDHSNCEETKQLFKKNNIKNTRQRQRVFEYLSICDQPVTAESIYKELSNLDESVNLSTVYRILDTFLKNKLITKTTTSYEQKATFEIFKMEHRHHLVCIKCNEVTPIKGCPLKSYEKVLSESTQFQIIEHKLEIFGICPKCQ